MKKVIFTLLALVASMSMNAQVMKVLDGDKVVATYTVDQADNVVFEAESTEETWTPLYVGEYYHRVASYAQSGKGVWSNDQSKLHVGTVLYQSDNDPSRFKLSPWIENEMIFTMDADNKIQVVNANTGYYVEDYETYICATDLLTAGLLEVDSQYNGDDVFWFELLWHDENDITASAGAWGFTEDAYLITGYYEEGNAKPLMAPLKHNFVAEKGNVSFQKATPSRTLVK